MVISLVRTELVTREEALVNAGAVELWRLVLDFPVLTVAGPVTGFALGGMDFAQDSTVKSLIFFGGGSLSVQ